MEEGQSSSTNLPAGSASRSSSPTTSWCRFFKEAAPEFQNLKFHSHVRGKKVSITRKDVVDEIQYWSSSVVGYVMGKKPYYHYFKSYVEKRWSKNFKLMYLKDGFFLVHFHDKTDVNKVLSRIHTFEGKPIILKRWSKNVNLEKEVLELVPIWIRIYDLPIHCRKAHVVSMVCSFFAKLIDMDDLELNQDKGRYLRVMVEVDVKEELPNSMVVDIHGIDCEITLEYE
ncbi:uncharacterized protein LOC132266223 [Cornus florida]|uniref:uncharacterized protein LOC132266223 n=1 Tax=Cornus florida TaxID=4283 RepID=UPI002898E320|nr:uncharacterized protein LOC132266223 [Cornus florida]